MQVCGTSNNVTQNYSCLMRAEGTMCKELCSRGPLYVFQAYDTGNNILQHYRQAMYAQGTMNVYDKM